MELKTNNIMKKFYLLCILMLLPLMASAHVSALQNEEKEPYAVLSDNNTVLTFYYDDQKTARNGMDVGPFYGYTEDGVDFSSWYGQKESITNVVFDDSFAGCTTLTSTAYWFNGLQNLSSITGISNLKTDNVTNMGSMFTGCRSLTSLDVTGFKTDNVTNMKEMFTGCSGLTSLDMTGFRTDNVTDMGAMFWYCSGLTSLDLSGFKTDNVTNMGGMFFGCSGLTSLDLSGFKTENVKYLDMMFDDCYALTSLDLSGFKTDNVTAMSGMFYGCSSLKTIYAGDGWSTANVQNGAGMFKGCSSLVGGAGTTYNANYTDHTYARIDGGSSNPGYFTDKNAMPSPSADPEPYAVLTDNDDEITTDNGTIKGRTLTFYYDNQKEDRGGMSVVFSSDTDRKWGFECEKITKAVFDGSFANCTSLTSTKWWFLFCKNLKTITGITNLKTDNVTDMTGMFYGCSSLTSLDLSSLNTGSLETMFGIFQDCLGLKSINLTNFKTDKVEEMGQLFLNCSSLESLDVSGFKTDEVSDMFNMFSGCSSLKSLDLSNFNTNKVENMMQMFRGCSNLTTIFVGSNWSTEAVTQSTRMFENCTNLVGGAGTTYDANHIDKAYARIDGGESNPGYFTDKNTTDQEDVDEITIKEIGKTTYCSKYDLDFTNVEGIKAYTATGYDNIDKTIWLTRVMKVPAGTGLLVKGDPGTYKIPHAQVQSAYANWFVGNLGETIKIEETDGDKTNYYLSGKDGSFVSVSGNANIGKNKAYLQLPTSIFAGTRTIGVSFDDEDGTTAIRETKQHREDGAYYTLQGQRVVNPGKGLYIHNGKKVVIK